MRVAHYCALGVLDIPQGLNRQECPQKAFMKLCSWYLTTQEFAVNACYEHHQNSIRFGYRCFDRILLNGLIQPFQQPERVVGFFSVYRNQYPVSRDVLREIADQFHNWMKNRSEKWGAPPCSMPPKVVGMSLSNLTFAMPNPTSWSSS